MRTVVRHSRVPLWAGAVGRSCGLGRAGLCDSAGHGLHCFLCPARLLLDL